VCNTNTTTTTSSITTPTLCFNPLKKGAATNTKMVNAIVLADAPYKSSLLLLLYAVQNEQILRIMQTLLLQTCEND